MRPLVGSCAGVSSRVVLAGRDKGGGVVGKRLFDAAAARARAGILGISPVALGTDCRECCGGGVGDYTYGKLGIAWAISSHVRTPSEVTAPANVTTWASVSAGFSHTCGIAASGVAAGRLLCWGELASSPRWQRRGRGCGGQAPVLMQPLRGCVRRSLGLAPLHWGPTAVCAAAAV